jgi:cell division protease FtsH
MTDFEEAMERVMLGPERKSRVIQPKEKKITAYHEAGHAVVMRALPNSDPLRKVTIIPRGFAAGLTWSLPEDDNSHMTRSKLKDMLAGILGGRAAEETVFSDITTGASNDLEKVTEIARSMVQRWGMSEKLGPLVYGKKEELVFLGKDLGEQRDYSEAVAQIIDGEVQRIVTEAHETALRLLTENRERLDRVARVLIEIETLDQEDFEKVWNGEELPKLDTPSGAPPAAPRPSKPASEAPTPAGNKPNPAPLPA